MSDKKPPSRAHEALGFATTRAAEPSPAVTAFNAHPPASHHLISVEDVSIWYGSSNQRPILKGVNLSAAAGEFICLVGPSGCGKSTLLKAIAGFTPIGSGSIKVNGAKVFGPGSDRGMVFQEFALFPWLTVEENVLFGDKASSGSKRACKDRATHYLDLVGLTKFRNY